jgi:hypothetical protein
MLVSFARMAHGPCGEDRRERREEGTSSEEEQKGGGRLGDARMRQIG